MNGMHLKQRPQRHADHREIEKPILTIKPKHDEAAGEGHKYARKMNERGHHSFELEIKQEKYEEQTDRDDHGSFFCGANLMFIISRKLISRACGKLKFARVNFRFNDALRLFNDVCFRGPFYFIKNHIAR